MPDPSFACTERGKLGDFQYWLGATAWPQAGTVRYAVDRTRQGLCSRGRIGEPLAKRLVGAAAGLAFALSALPYCGTAAYAQAYPVRSIHLIVPFPPGGGADVTARTIAQKVSETIGQTVVIDNRAGAGGNIGTEATARSAPDGYTYLLTTNGHTIQPNLQKVPWDPIKDFAPVSLVVTYPLVVVVHPSVQATSIKELIALAKARPGKLSYGSSGPGTNLNLAVELLKSLAGIDILHVPYKGNAPVTTAILSGEIQLVVDSLTGPLPHIRSGKLRALAVTSNKRSPVLPDLPTMAEAGVSDYEFLAWSGILAPAGTPKDVVARFAAELAKAVTTQAVSDRLTGLGYEPVSNSPDQFAAFIAAELAKYRKIIKEAGIRTD